VSVQWERVRAVCFDMDGTLVDSDGAWLKATRAAFARLGLPLTDALYAETLGLDNASGVKAVLRHFPGFKGDPKDLIEGLERAIQAEFRRGVIPMPGAEKLLERWATRWPLALVSTSSEALIEAALAGLGWGRFFKLKLSSERVGPSKPDPAVYREAARRLGVDLADALAIEDSLNGVKSAQAAGMPVIGVTADPDLAVRMGPYVTERVADLAELLDKVEFFRMA
jgi:HAD superfamily hydrolase (TIGR01509 family)